MLLLGDVGAARGEDDLMNEAYREMELVLSGMERSRMVARLWRSLGDALSEAGDALGVDQRLRQGTRHGRHASAIQLARIRHLINI